jgi:hypothetical protein
MSQLSIVDPQLSESVQATLSKLSRCGLKAAGKHMLSATELKANRLSVTLLRELVSAGVAQSVDEQGRVWRHMTPVATEVELFDSGDVYVTLAVELVN